MNNSTPIKLLKDENNNTFIPYTATTALLDPLGRSLDNVLATKLDLPKIIQGSGITLTKDTINNTVTIASNSAGLNLIDNITTTIANQGALDAHQGYILKGLIDAVPVVDVVDNLTTIDSTKALSAYQGYLLNNKFNDYAKLNTINTFSSNQIFGAGLTLTETKNILLRPNHSSYTSGIGYDTSGNECIAIWAKSSVTRLRWNAGIDMSNLAPGTMMNITPDFEISKSSGSAIGYIAGNKIYTDEYHPNATYATNATTANKTTGTLTLQLNGTSKGTFNGSANTTINMSDVATIPNLNEIFTTQTFTWSVGALAKLTFAETNITITKSGYTALGVVGQSVGGSLSSYLLVSTCRLNTETNLRVACRNMHTSSSTSDATINIIILYRKNF